MGNCEMNLNRYPKYKPTGIAWLPEVPEGWEVRKVRQLLTMVSRKGFPEKQLLSVTREQGVVVRDVESKEENHNFIPDDLSNYNDEVLIIINDNDKDKKNDKIKKQKSFSLKKLFYI